MPSSKRLVGNFLFIKAFCSFPEWTIHVDTSREQFPHDATEFMLKLLCPLHAAGYCNYFPDHFPAENLGFYIYVCM